MPLIQFDAGTADTPSIALQLSSLAHDVCAVAQRRGDASILLLADRSGRQLFSTATPDNDICHRSSARWMPPPCISQRNTAIPATIQLAFTQSSDVKHRMIVPLPGVTAKNK
ncbi:hypothetical protein WI560_08675 [Bradyrhizobium sp. A11]|uniref:hypothetical protein n=1 Tax=Bradyrhizobium sp. A11 TaxID=3133974 RepID=UPI00324BAC79